MQEVVLTEMEQKFFDHLALGQPIRRAAELAGYAETTCSTHIYKMLKKPEFIAKIQAYAQQCVEFRKAYAKLRLPRLAKLEDKFFEECEKNPEWVGKYPKPIERELRIARLLTDDVPMQQTINIGEIKILISQGIPDKQEIPDKAESASRRKL